MTLIMIGYHGEEINRCVAYSVCQIVWTWTRNNSRWAGRPFRIIYICWKCQRSIKLDWIWENRFVKNVLFIYLLNSGVCFSYAIVNISWCVMDNGARFFCGRGYVNRPQWTMLWGYFLKKSSPYSHYTPTSPSENFTRQDEPFRRVWERMY